MKNFSLNFFDQDFLKDIIGALIGTGTALIIFYLTIREDRKKEKVQTRKQNSQRLKYFINLLTSTKKQIEIFQKNLGTQSTSFSPNELKFPILIYSPDFSLERTKLLMENESYFFAFTEIYGRKKIELYNEIANSVDFFISQEKQIVEMTERDSKVVIELKKEFGELVHQLFHYRISSLTKREDLLDQKYITEINKIYDGFYKTLKENDINYFHSHFIRPVLENVLVKNTDKPEILELIFELKKLISIKRNIEHQIQIHEDELKYIFYNYSERVSHFRNITDQLDK